MSDGKTFLTAFEDLPVEIFLQIFTLLSLPEIVTAFHGLNSHIDSIIRSVRNQSHVVKFNDICAVNALQLFPTSIRYLTIINVETIDFASMINLRSLTLKYGSQRQLDTIRPQYLPMLETLYIKGFRAMASDNAETINNLFDVILSDGFPRLRICKAYGMGALTFSKTWAGSTTLRVLNLKMKTENDYEQLRSICPYLHQFTNDEYPTHMVATVNSGHIKRILLGLRKLGRLEIENKFILNDDPMMLSHGDIKPARYNRTKPIQRSRDASVSVIQGRIFPTSEPYCRASFLIEIIFPPEYPFKQPSVIFLDPIYHPNVLENGKFFCCPHVGRHRLHTDILACDYLGCRYGKSKLTATFVDLIEDMIRIIDRPPIIDRSANVDCAQEYFHNYQVFYQKALKLTLSYGRPLY